MAQRQLPAGGFVDDTGTAGRQAQLPAGGFLDLPSAANVVDVPAGVLTLTAHTPSVAQIQRIGVPAGALVLTGFAPDVVVSADNAIDVPLARLTLRALEMGAVNTTPAAPTRRAWKLLLTDNLPLRLASELGTFAAAQTLPHRYGDLRKTRFNLLRMTATKFFAADHPMEITRAFVGDLETQSFAFKTEASGRGTNYTVVEFAAPVPLGTEATASGIGKRNAVTGALIENPADILADILAIAGRDDPWWHQLRAEASAAGIVLAGSIGGSEAIRTFLDSVVSSSGAIWCPGMARLYPVDFAGFKIDLDRFSVSNVQVSAALTDTADILRLAYDYDEAEDRNQSFLELTANPKRYGGVQVDIEMPFIRSAAVAESIGIRMLRWYAGERYDVAFDMDDGEFVRPGTWALLAGHPNWPFADDPYIMLTEVVAQGRARVSVRGEAFRAMPEVAVTGHSIGTNSIGAGGVEVTERNGVATFTVRDADDKPISGAYVSLDGAAPKKTDGQGQVSFTVTEDGEHQLDIAAPGYLPQSLTVILQG